MTNPLAQTIAMHTSHSAKRERELIDALERYLTALEAGTPLDVEAIAAEHPHLAEELRHCVQGIDLVHAASPAARSRTIMPSQGGMSGARRIGDFEIGPEIGRGGMGVVYEATQISLQRRVALKVLPFAAMWDQKQVARFQNEARAAAQLQHPHIVPVFAVGQERGIHFFAMQLIEGKSLEECIQLWRHDHENLPPASQANGALPATTRAARTTARIDAAFSEMSVRLRTDKSDYCRAVANLGVQAAEAVHYAHECGVVHRDLKPSNMMIDCHGKLWITDFGLARLENSPGVTTTGDVVGTLRYMSPEQAAGRHALVDACSDVYALGASLYELLTLEPAFTGEVRHEVQHAILHVEPVSPRRLNPAIPPDLETIVLQALAKSRDERYATAADLAEDLKRYLAGKATHARRRTLVDHVAIWVKRHRKPVTLAIALLCVLCAGSAFALIQFSREHARTLAALAQSEKSRAQARHVVDRFGSRFSRQLAHLPGSAPLQQELLGETLALYRQFIAESAEDPTLADEVAKTHFQAGAINWRLGNHDAATEAFTESLTMFANLEHASAEPTELQRHQAACLNNLGLLSSSHGDTAAARTFYERGLQLIAPKLAEQQPQQSVVLRAELYINQALLERLAGNAAQASDLLAAATHELEHVVQQKPNDRGAVHSLAIALNSRSFVEQPDWRKALDSSQRAVALLHKLCKDVAADDPLASDYRNDLALCLNNLAAIHAHRDDSQHARQAYEQAIELQTQLARRAPADVRYRAELAVTWNNLGQTLAGADETDAADAAFASARNLLTDLADDYPLELRYRSTLAGVLNNQAMASERRQHWERALADYEAAIENQRSVFEQAPDQPLIRDLLSKHYLNYARALRAAGRPADALEVAFARRELWMADAPRLVRVAAELGAAADLLEGKARQSALDAAAETCRQALQCGWKQTPLDDASEFRDVQCRREIQKLLEMHATGAEL